jgi:mannose-6-phosphate isomerase
MIMICPARLEPIFSPRPWGSKSLAPFFPERSNLTEPIGEAWMTGSECRFACGPFAGEKLGEAWSKMPVEWTGTRFKWAGSVANSSFPLLAKFIFAEEKLSVQVHPDDEYASRHERAAGGLGKTEMWYAVNARPGADVLAGLKPDTTLESFKHAIANGTAEDCLDRIPLVSGDATFVPAGTVHTIGPGFVLCEIQEYSDLTYRVYDYNRRDAMGRARELHIDKALQVIRFGKQEGGKIEPFRIERGSIIETHFVVCRYFAVEKWEFRRPLLASTSPEYFELWIILDGSGTIRWDGERAAYGPAQAWLIPAALGDYEITPQTDTSLLRAYVPGDLSEAARGLEARGIPAAAVTRLVHR